MRSCMWLKELKENPEVYNRDKCRSLDLGKQNLLEHKSKAVGWGLRTWHEGCNHSLICLSEWRQVSEDFDSFLSSCLLYSKMPSIGLSCKQGAPESGRGCYAWEKAEQMTAAATKSLQSCPTLCDPIDGSPLGSPVPGILQARTLEWVAISFSNAWKWKEEVKSLSQSCLTLSDPMDCSLPGSSAHGIFQARVLEWGATAFSEKVRCIAKKPNVYFRGKKLRMTSHFQISRKAQELAKTMTKFHSDVF